VVDDEPGGPMHWELAKLFWDGPGPEDRRFLWFSHRDPVTFDPADYEDVLWQLGETGFEPVAYHAWPVPGAAGGFSEGPDAPGLREVTLFKRPLGYEPGGHAHEIGDEEGEEEA
jgi:hypothetical protein